MSHNIRYTLVIMLTLIAMCLFNLGMDYINLGYGLHPAIATPIVILIAVAVYHITKPEPIWRSSCDSSDD